MQSLGSAITYARRYSMAAILGITQEDDDAVTAMPSKQNTFIPANKPIVTNSAGYPSKGGSNC